MGHLLGIAANADRLPAVVSQRGVGAGPAFGFGRNLAADGENAELGATVIIVFASSPSSQRS